MQQTMMCADVLIHTNGNCRAGRAYAEREEHSGVHRLPICHQAGRLLPGTYLHFDGSLYSLSVGLHAAKLFRIIMMTAKS
jgi:hypothetical protein